MEERRAHLVMARALAAVVAPPNEAGGVSRRCYAFPDVYVRPEAGKSVGIQRQMVRKQPLLMKFLGSRLTRGDTAPEIVYATRNCQGSFGDPTRTKRY